MQFLRHLIFVRDNSVGFDTRHKPSAHTVGLYWLLVNQAPPRQILFIPMEKFG